MYQYYNPDGNCGTVADGRDRSHEPAAGTPDSPLWLRFALFFLGHQTCSIRDKVLEQRERE